MIFARKEQQTEERKRIPMGGMSKNSDICKKKKKKKYEKNGKKIIYKQNSVMLLAHQYQNRHSDCQHTAT